LEAGTFRKMNNLL